MTGELPERIVEDIDVLGAEESGTDTVQITKGRLQHLRDIERLALLFLDGLLDETQLRRALETQVEAGA
jgi:hypothetical protein